jgi:hypothetical protein
MMIKDIVLLNRYTAMEASSGTGEGGFRVGDVVALKYALPVPALSTSLNPCPLQIPNRPESPTH